MTVTLNLKPEIESGLVVQARASGTSLEDYLLSVIEQAAARGGQAANRSADPTRVESVRRMLAFGEEHHLSLGEPVSRRILHEGHRV